MSEVVILILSALAGYRLTRLVTTDRLFSGVFGRLREWYERRWERRHGLEDIESESWQSFGAYFLSCAWCVGFWISGAITLVMWRVADMDYPVLMWLAVSTLVGLLGELERE